MSMRYQAGILTASYFPLKTPSAPTIGAATRGNSQVSVAFTAPADVGGGAVTSYQVVVTDSSSGAVFTNTGASSPIVVTGLTNGNNYTAKVAAINAFGAGPYSSNSSSFSPTNAGQQAYTTAGTYSWVAPAQVTSVCAVAIGGGGGGAGTWTGSSARGDGGGGGGLGWKNNITVVPGNSYTVFVGAAGSGGNGSQGYNAQDSYFINSSTVRGGGGTTGFDGVTGVGGSFTGDGGGNGGNGGSNYGGGGGAGGYAGNGGNGGPNTGGSSTGGTGSGGAGGGGGTMSVNNGGGFGGSTGVWGQGINGTGGTPTGGYQGRAGSTIDGSTNVIFSNPPANTIFSGAAGGGHPNVSGSGTAGPGAVRIIWGTGRAFPSTNTGDL